METFSKGFIAALDNTVYTKDQHYHQCCNDFNISLHTKPNTNV